MNGAVTVAELLAAYRATAERWHELRDDAPAANPVFDENERLARELHASAAGRSGIAACIAHEASGVRALAAAHALALGEAEAEAVAALEALAAGDGLHAIAAEHALAEFRAGRLGLDV